jgi:hypothetical protein
MCSGSSSAHAMTLGGKCCGKPHALPFIEFWILESSQTFDLIQTPYSDQWAFLSSIQHIDPNRVREIVQDAGRSGRGSDGERHANWLFQVDP